MPIGQFNQNYPYINQQTQPQQMYNNVGTSTPNQMLQQSQTVPSYQQSSYQDYTRSYPYINPNYFNQANQWDKGQNNQNQGIVWVQGEAGAKAYPVAPNNTIMLLDSEADVFYIKSTDSSGMPLPLRIFDFSERNTGNQVSQLQKTEQSQYITREEFEERISSLLSSQQQRRDYEQSVQRTEQQSNGRTKQHGKHDANVQSV